MGGHRAEDADVQTVHVAREALGPAVAGGPGANGRVGDIDRAEVGFLAGAQLLRAGGGEPQPSSIPQRAWHEVVSREAVKGLACRFSGPARPRVPNYLRRRTHARACSSFGCVGMFVWCLVGLGTLSRDGADSTTLRCDIGSGN